MRSCQVREGKSKLFGQTGKKGVRSGFGHWYHVTIAYVQVVPCRQPACNGWKPDQGPDRSDTTHFHIENGILFISTNLTLLLVLVM